MLPKYKARDIEHLAIRLLEERCKPDIVIPIDIDFIVESEPNIILDYVPLLRDRWGVAGVVMKKPEGSFAIYIDERIADKSPNFYRFTLAEEYAHYKLHRPVIERIKTFEEAVLLRDSDDYWIMDRNARRYAAALLMPSQFLLEDARSFYAKIVRIAGFANPIAVKDRLADRLSRKYQVSPEAMKHRLNEWPIKIMEKIEEAMGEKLDFLPE